MPLVQGAGSLSPSRPAARRCAILPNAASRFPIGPAGWWVLAALASGVVELLSPTFGFVFVSLAALAAAGLAGLGASFSIQLAVFSAVLLVCLVFLRPRFARRLEAQGVASRVEALVGRVGVVTSALDPRSHTGRVEVAGQDWAARCAVALPPGAPVRVVGADGIVLEVVPDEGSAAGGSPAA